MSFMGKYDYLRERYNPEGSELRRRQLVMLNILCTIDSICKKHSIKYMLSYGTALGAVRHSGFIPWDDDLDIEMLPNDYKKFLNVVSDELPIGMALQTHRTDSNYWGVYAKIRDCSTTIEEKTGGCLYDKYKYKGLYVDVFMIEPSHYKISKFSDILYSNVIIKNAKKLKSPLLTRILLKIPYLLLTTIIFPFLRLFSKKSKEYRPSLGSYVGVERRLWDDIKDTKYINFEGYAFPIAINTHSYLMNIYGDYLTIPNEEDRLVHTEIIN